MLIRGSNTGGNWSAHCISTWQWITICFVVCPSVSFSICVPVTCVWEEDFLSGGKTRKKQQKQKQKQKKQKANGSAIDAAGHTAFFSQTERGRVSHLQFHAGFGVSPFCFGLAPHPPYLSLSLSLSTPLLSRYPATAIWIYVCMKWASWLTNNLCFPPQ